MDYYFDVKIFKSVSANYLMALEEIKDAFANGYAQVLSLIPSNYSNLVNILVFSILISLYAIFTWNFYRNLSKKDLIGLDLAKYNKSNHPLISKIFACIFYILEYIILLPILIFFWFAVLALIIMIMSEGHSTQQVLTVTAAIVAAIRITSYYQEELSRDIAKLFPLTVLAISLLTPDFFSLDRILSFLNEIPTFFGSIIYFFVLIITIELILRIIDLAVGIFDNEGERILNEKGIKVPVAG